MAKTETPAAELSASQPILTETPALLDIPVTAEATTEPTPLLAINEFCRRKSETDSRSELIAGFYSDEVRTGQLKDTASNFEARFEAFINKPA